MTKDISSGWGSEGRESSNMFIGQVLLVRYCGVMTKEVTTLQALKHVCTCWVSEGGTACDRVIAM